MERTTVHVSDDGGRMAMLETRTQGSAADDHGTEQELTRYVYSNHLQSAALELDGSGEVISYEEYHPYGTTAYQATSASIKAVAKRYRFTGKERDEESGLSYHGARYYAPWLCRWIAVDPLESKYTPQSPYVYCSCHPVNRTDDTGMGDFDKYMVKREVPAAQQDVLSPSMLAPNSSDPVKKPAPSAAPIVPSQSSSDVLHKNVAHVLPIKHVETSSERFKRQMESRMSGRSAVQSTIGPTLPLTAEEKQEHANAIAQMERDQKHWENFHNDFGYAVAQSPGIQTGLAMALPEVGMIQGGAQAYNGMKTNNKTEFALGLLQIGLSGYSIGRSVSIGVGDGRTASSGAMKTLAGFDSDEAIVENTANLTTKNGWFDVVIHGTEDGLGFTISGSYITPEQLYEQMLAEGYVQGTKVRLMSCYSGMLENGAASQLQKLTNSTVIAPTGALSIFPEGSNSFLINVYNRYHIYSSEFYEVGKFVTFK